MRGRPVPPTPAIALVALVALTACSARGARCARPGSCGGRTVSGPCAGPVASREPAHARRDHCLAAPWAPGPEEAPSLAGFAHALGERPSQHVLVRAGARPWSEEEIAAFRTAHEAELFALGGVQGSGTGLFCGATVEDHRARPQLHLEVDACSHRLDELAAWIGERLAPSVPDDATVRICISLTGLLGPRCAPDDPACGPTPYSGTLESAGYACERDRTTFAWTLEEGLSRGACTHDGECVEAGCGNHCVAWPEAGFGATCEGYLDLESAPALCGCVAGTCTWFRM